METLKFDLSKKLGKFKLLNATNGGPWTEFPWSSRPKSAEDWSNFLDYEAAKIPYSRNHDSNICGLTYGGPYVHDVSVLFPNFNADENDPASYDFPCTDKNVLDTLEAGTKTFFRLGESIEQQVKKHATIPPKDFHKWARICEHIIRHYTEGWADGLALDMDYWEIWNEPDLGKNLWDGTKEEFFDFYAIAAKHLKECFPHLKIGGPALAKDEIWADEFLTEMQKREVPIDFFSWHIYCNEPVKLSEKSQRIRALLDKHGYAATESICNEWNYLRSWGEMYRTAFAVVRSYKGSAFTMACISEAQKNPIDMLMYYDTRPGLLCGAFDYYTRRPLPGYYPLFWYGNYFSGQREVRCETEIPEVYTLCSVDENGKVCAVITNYSDDDTLPSKEIAIDFGKNSEYALYWLDEAHDATIPEQCDKLSLTLPPYSCVLIKEI